MEGEEVDVPHDPVELQLADLWTLEGVLRKWVANLVGARSLLEGLDELVVDAILDVDTRSSTAALAMVEEDAKVDPANGVLNVCIVENDIGALAAQLQGDLLQVGAGCRLHDLPANDGRAGEGDLVNVYVRGDGSAGGLAKAAENVDHAWRETSFLDKLGSVESAEWGLLSRLQNDGITTGDGGADLPGPHEKREVPWDDLANDTDLKSCLVLQRWRLPGDGKETHGFLLRIVESLGIRIDHLALNLVGPTAVVPQAAGAHADIHFRHAECLAIVQSLDGR